MALLDGKVVHVSDRAAASFSQTSAAARNEADGGYRIVPGVLEATDTAALIRALESLPLLRSRAGARHLMRHAAVSRTAHDSRLLDLARAFVGPNPVPYRATLFDKSAARNWLVTWHQDTALPLRGRRDVAGWGPWSVKGGITYALAPASALARVIALRVHLDDSTADNGPLKVLPGTHALGLLSAGAIEGLVRDISAVDCLVAAGGVVAMRPLILHASSKAETDCPRRVLHIEYAGSLDTVDGMRIAVA